MSRIRLTESQLHNVIRRCVTEAIVGVDKEDENDDYSSILGTLSDEIGSVRGLDRGDNDWKDFKAGKRTMRDNGYSLPHKDRFFQEYGANNDIPQFVMEYPVPKGNQCVYFLQTPKEAGGQIFVRDEDNCVVHFNSTSTAYMPLSLEFHPDDVIIKKMSKLYDFDWGGHDKDVYGKKQFVLNNPKAFAQWNQMKGEYHDGTKFTLYIKSEDGVINVFTMALTSVDDMRSRLNFVMLQERNTNDYQKHQGNFSDSFGAMKSNERRAGKEEFEWDEDLR